MSLSEALSNEHEVSRSAVVSKPSRRPRKHADACMQLPLPLTTMILARRRTAIRVAGLSQMPVGTQALLRSTSAALEAA